MQKGKPEHTAIAMAVPSGHALMRRMIDLDRGSRRLAHLKQSQFAQQGAVPLSV